MTEILLECWYCGLEAPQEEMELHPTLPYWVCRDGPACDARDLARTADEEE